MEISRILKCDEDLMDGKDVVDILKSPRIVRLGFFGKETEGSWEGLIVSRHTGNMEEWHLVFDGFVGAIEEEDGMIGGKEVDGSQMTEK